LDEESGNARSLMGRQYVEEDLEDLVDLVDVVGKQARKYLA
jgi:hypothetical protein